MFEKYTLKNGATVVLVPQSNTKSITTMIMFPVGSRNETEKLSGVSHYVEHLMFKGTQKRPSTLQLTKEIDRLGAQYNAFTGKEYTGYYIKTDASYVDISLDILSDMLFASTYDPQEMEREKHVIVEELRMYKDNPIMDIDNVFEELMFDGCALGRDIGGTEKHVLAYERDEVLAYRDTHYQPNNTKIVLAGNITEETKQKIEKYFGEIENKETSDRSYEPGLFGSDKKEDCLKVVYKDTDQVQMMIGVPGVKRGSDLAPTLSVLNTILGGSMSSRLFIKIRERLGLAYTVRSGAEYYQDTGYLYVQAGLEAKNVNKAIEAIKVEIEKIKSEGVTAQELADAKTHIKGRLTLSLEDSSSVASWFVRKATLSNEISTPEEWIKKIEGVTLESVQQIANDLYDLDALRVGLIGRLKKEDIIF